MAGEDGATALVEAGAAGGSGGLALASHSVKASIRLAVNSSPEPFSNVAISLAEDLAVALVVWLATDHPLARGGRWRSSLLICGVTLALFLAKAVRAGLRRLTGAPRRRRERRRAADGGGPSSRRFRAARPAT